MKAFVAALGLSLFACGSNTESVNKSVCTAEIRWTGGNSGSPEMRPGNDCIGCHSTSGGPAFSFAGTVYGEAHQADDCFGLAGVTVRITGADGAVVEGTSNGAGNFFVRTYQQPVTPYTASILYNGQETKMITPQTEFACNSCHTQAGANNAPGRILPSNAVAFTNEPAL